MLPLPTDIDKQAGDVDLRYSLVEHSAKFQKTCKLKFRNEKFEKAKRKREKNRPADRLQLLRHTGKVRLLQIDSGRKSYKQ